MDQTGRERASGRKLVGCGRKRCLTGAAEYNFFVVLLEKIDESTQNLGLAPSANLAINVLDVNPHSILADTELLRNIFCVDHTLDHQLEDVLFTR